MTKSRLNNFLEILAPLSKSDHEIDDLIIISHLEELWAKNKEIKVNDFVDSISNISQSTLHRRLKNLRLNHILEYEPSKNDWRVRFIKKGEGYQRYLNNIEMSLDNAIKKL